MSDIQIYKIKELDMEIIAPCTERMNEKDYGGSKIAVIGRPGSGKTTIIKNIIYYKKHIFGVGIVMSGTEATTGTYKKIFPSTFVYNDYSAEKVEDFIKRQKLAKDYVKNPWAIILLDDCTDDPKIFNTETQLDMYKHGRHYKMLYILSLQHAMDIKPAIRSNVDGVFIMRDPLLKNRKTLWENYASIVPDFSLFCQLMNDITDEYTALYIHNSGQSNVWQECVFWYKARRYSRRF